MNALCEKVRAIEGEERFAHTLSVANECLFLAGIFSLTVPMTRRLYKAAILHDITKHLSKDEHIALANELGTALTADDIESPAVLHQVTGAALIKRDFPECASDTVISAVRKHTTGDGNMSITDKILFLADYIEPLRKWESCIKTREYFYFLLKNERKTKALDLAVIRCLENTISHLREKDVSIHKSTLDAHASLTSLYTRKDG